MPLFQFPRHRQGDLFLQFPEVIYKKATVNVLSSYRPQQTQLDFIYYVILEKNSLPSQVAVKYNKII